MRTLIVVVWGWGILDFNLVHFTDNVRINLSISGMEKSFLFSLFYENKESALMQFLLKYLIIII